jgi:hypothetical protein
VGQVAPVAKPVVDVGTHEAVLAENAALRARLAGGDPSAMAAARKRRARVPSGR